MEAAGGRDVERSVVRDTVAGTALLEGGEGVVAMLSGGRDSVCLLDIAVALRGAAAVQALHCNYGLREGADGDEALCAALCDRLGVPLVVERPRRDGPNATGNLHAWARDARYGAAFRAADGLGAAALVATGHTASDQAETVLYRLAASPGRRALLGMAERRGRLVRPLLAITREQTAEHCRARGLQWREDPSNDDRSFARARVRHELLDALRAVHPAAEASVVRTAAELREESELLDELVDRELAAARAETGAGRISLGRLRALPPGLARLVVRRLAEDVAETLAPDAARRHGEFLALGGDGRAYAELHLGEGLRAVVERGVLRFTRDAE